jgi:hypothetical protein
MSEIKDGGQAFPVQHENGFTVDGMTLRDYFAAKAMAAMITASIGEANRVEIANQANNRGMELKDSVAAAAYEHADAMLRARGQT